ncbi:hypothetical protein NOS3756_14100 [Nostoc sp. NIES-3756]|uniref:hypothetical protein n=1 Tax=Nostoc sp. NIES-3756 TaxID=1751286 RepID=UPI000722F356|nr:hypothetical protein [Nostoc sp. NIES-3756]BAT52470.1 hypothetical protein NOS3756_14100 [Nostoc sp. NIES-3756]
MAASYQIKIVALWVVFLLGTLFHTQLGLMPIFHGLSVVESQKATNLNEIAGIMWLMLGFFVLPMLAIIGTVFTESKRYRIVHFWLTIIYSVLNFLHLVLDLLLPQVIWYQITLMVFLFFIGLLLNMVAFQWMKAPSRNHHAPESLSTFH